MPLDVTSIMENKLDLRPSEVIEYLTNIFEIQPSCISRSEYHIGTNFEELQNRQVCPPSVMLWGPPGIGKSAAVKQAAAHAGITGDNYSDIRLSTLEPVDLRGIPSVIYGRTIYNPPEIFPIGQNEIDDILKTYKVKTLQEAQDKANRDHVEKHILDRIEKAIGQSKGVLLFDELTSAQRDIQIAAYEIILDRKIGKYTLPMGWAIVAAGNRPSEVSGVAGTAGYLPIPLSNRMIHIGVRSETKDWENWATWHGFSPTVISFGMNELPVLEYIKQDRGYGPGETAETGVPAFLSPRSLEWLDYIEKQIESGIVKKLNINNNADDEDTNKEKSRVTKALYRSAIGTGEATKYLYFKKTADFLLSGVEIYNNPEMANQYFKILNKVDLNDSDIEKLANIKIRASGVTDPQALKNEFMQNFRAVYEGYYKHAMITRSYYPTMLLFNEYIGRFNKGTTSKDNFILGGKAIINNLTDIDSKAVLTLHVYSTLHIQL